MIELHLVEGSSTKPFEQAVEQLLQKDIAHFEKELTKLRTGRANPSMIEDYRVSCYGTGMKLKEVASISAPEAQLLVIQPWDNTLIPEIEKTLSTSDLKVNPTNDGSIIRIVLPRMSSERRDDLIKLLHKKLEECKVAIRTNRENIRKLIKDTEKTKSISEDYARRLNDLLQKITQKYTDLVEKMGSKKEIEITSI